MALKELSVQRKFKYESPDGDVYTITYAENESRKYVEILRDGETEPRIYDYDMLVDITDKLRRATRTGNSIVMTAPALVPPQITDHRSGNPIRVAAGIQQSVDRSMDRYDDSLVPAESLAAVAYHQNATGVRVGTPPVDDTPPDLSLHKDESELTEWQRDAKGRISTPFKGQNPEAKIRARHRVDPSELIG